jgi:hypothetical protein
VTLSLYTGEQSAAAAAAASEKKQSKLQITAIRLNMVALVAYVKKFEH